MKTTSEPFLKLEEFGRMLKPNERGGNVLRDAFKGRNSSRVVVALEASENEFVPTDSIPGFSSRVLGGMNGASIHPGLPYKLELLHDGMPVQGNMVRFVRLDYVPPNHSGGVLCY